MNNHLIWIDLEMTGLDPEKQVILEIASIVTDDHLDIVAEGPEIAITYPEHVFSEMEEWSREHHQSSGLLDRSRDSSYDCYRAEMETLKFLSLYSKKGQSPLCGNSVYQDRRFLIKYMPKLEGLMHYRNIDVSSVKELVKRWYPTLPRFKKQKSHLAMDDIRGSIMELRYYHKKVFLSNPAQSLNN